LNENNTTLWNSGTEEKPVKTQYDPCPAGWRVPTNAELTSLTTNNSGWTTDNGMNGAWFSGKTAYSKAANQIFLPAPGRHEGIVNTINGPICSNRETMGYYWTSTYKEKSSDSYYVMSGMYTGKGGGTPTYKVVKTYSGRLSACSVRCVHE
jgi:uncharacterized protein (TIGR02145 family)